MAKLLHHQRVIIALSLGILRSGVAEAAGGRVDMIKIRLAQRCLLPNCPECWPLELYWDAAGQDNDIGRVQGATAAFNGIVRQLRKAGCCEDGLKVS